MKWVAKLPQREVQFPAFQEQRAEDAEAPLHEFSTSIHKPIQAILTFTTIISFTMSSNVEGGLALLSGIKTQKSRLQI